MRTCSNLRAIREGSQLYEISPNHSPFVNNVTWACHLPFLPEPHRSAFSFPLRDINAVSAAEGEKLSDGGVVGNWLIVTQSEATELMRLSCAGKTVEGRRWVRQLGGSGVWQTSALQGSNRRRWTHFTKSWICAWSCARSGADCSPESGPDRSER